MTRRSTMFAAGALALMAGTASAQQFSAGIPAGWACVGTCGALGANGVVTLAPGGGTQYGYVSTNGGVGGVALPGVGGSGAGTDGSRLRSSAFTANGGDVLDFDFNYITSDGTGFADYAWARLLDAGTGQVALLFTARTTTSGNTVPGFSMPAPEATLTPSSTPIIGTCGHTSVASNACPTTDWSPLGVNNATGGSKDCWQTGCGYTGWINAQYSIASSGSYILEFGVTNWNDNSYQSGLAFDGLKINNTPIDTATPEPASMTLLATGIAGLAMKRRRKSKTTAA